MNRFVDSCSLTELLCKNSLDVFKNGTGLKRPASQIVFVRVLEALITCMICISFLHTQRVHPRTYYHNTLYSTVKITVHKYSTIKLISVLYQVRCVLYTEV